MELGGRQHQAPSFFLPVVVIRLDRGPEPTSKCDLQAVASTPRSGRSDAAGRSRRRRRAVASTPRGGRADAARRRDSVEVYSPRLDRWTTAAPLPGSIGFLSGAALNATHVLAAGGAGTGSTGVESFVFHL